MWLWCRGAGEQGRWRGGDLRLLEVGGGRGRVWAVLDVHWHDANPSGAGSCWALAVWGGSREVRERGGHGTGLPRRRHLLLHSGDHGVGARAPVPGCSSSTPTQFLPSFECGEAREVRGIEGRQKFSQIRTQSIDLIRGFWDEHGTVTRCSTVASPKLKFKFLQIVFITWFTYIYKDLWCCGGIYLVNGTWCILMLFNVKERIGILNV